MISFIIPTLNEEKVIGTTLAQFKNLTAFPYEVIVSDGKSSDQTVAIAKNHADQVIEYTDAKRQTIAMGRNMGASVAKGDFLVFIDADVSIPDINNFFKETLQRFDTDPELVALTVKQDVPKDTRTFSDRLFFGIVNMLIYLSNNVFHSGGSSGEFQMVRKNAFHQIQGYDETLVVGEDGNLFVRLSEIGKARIAMNLRVFHLSRRAHETGWPALLYVWMMNLIYVKLFNRSYSSEWTEIR